MHPLLLAAILVLALILDFVILRLIFSRRWQKTDHPDNDRTGEKHSALQALKALSLRLSHSSGTQPAEKNGDSRHLSHPLQETSPHINASTIIEISLLIIWAFWVGRNFLNFNPDVWLMGSDFPLNIETHYIWNDFSECGLCALWNGSLNGGFPAFSDLLAPVLHPLVVAGSLMAGVINGTKIMMLGSLIMAGLAQWWIGQTLGLGRISRLWAGGMAIVGGHLAGRMEMGLIGMTLSNAAFSLALAAGLALGFRKRRTYAVWFGIFFGLALLSGQGYAQIGFLLCISPLFIVFAVNDNLRLDPVWKEFVLAGILGLLIAGVLLVPTIHFLPNFGKEVDTGHQSAQPFGYGILNFVVRDIAFFQNESLGKVLLPSIYMNFIGWVPIILAVISFFFFTKERWRTYTFFGLSIFMLFLASSSAAIDTLARWLPSVIDRFRYPPLLTGLVVPLMLALASISLDHLLKITWPKLALETQGGHKIQVPLTKVILVIPLGLALLNAYTFSQIWYVTNLVPRDVKEFARELADSGSQWVEPPKKSFVWIPPLIESGQKITRVYRPWHWKYREPPTGGIQAFLQSDVIPEGEFIDQIETVRVIRIPYVHYAYVRASNNQITPCQANARGGNIDIHCESSTSGILYVQENAWGGWKAYQDGERVSLKDDRWLAVNAAPGDHQYSFRYRPLDVPLGLGFTLAGLVISGWILLNQTGSDGGEPEGSSRMERTLENGAPLLDTEGEQGEDLKPLEISRTSAGEELRPAEPEDMSSSSSRQDRASKLVLGAKHILMRSIQWFRITQNTFTSWLQALSTGWLFFILACITYLIIRLIGLTDFPIYFFTDEAVQSVLASDLIRDGFHGYDGVFLPTYFENAWLFNLSLSVYLQVIPVMLFGKTVFVTRFISVLVGLSGAVAVGLTLRDAFRTKHWWAGILVLSAIPAWFLHSRTAFETVIFVAMMAWTLYFYLLYRSDRPNSLYAAVVFGALSFYSYRGGQIVLIAFAAVIFLVDLPYHIRHRKTVLISLGIVVILLLPYLRFQLIHGEESYFQLRMLDSYWLHNISIKDKLSRFGKIYLQALDPRYWLAPGPRDLSRHTMKGHGHISPFMIPFFLLGFVQALANIKQPQYRTSIILGVLSPLGAALVGVGITRLLIFVIPVALLTTLGLSSVLGWMCKRASEWLNALLLFSILLLFNSFLLWDSLTRGPTWYQDYGLGGMQYGAAQVFQIANELIEEDPNLTIYVSPTWANGADILKRFFVQDGSQVFMGNAEGFLDQLLDMNDETYFILTSDEFRTLSESPKIASVDVLDTIMYPDGRVGFFVTSFEYSPEAPRLFAEEQQARSMPRTGTIVRDGQTIEVQHPYLDMGALHHIFDDDAFTLARVYSANPAVFTIFFAEPTRMEGVRVTTGSMDMALAADVFIDGQSEPLQFSSEYTGLPDDPTVTLPFGEVIDDVVELRIQIHALTEADPFKIHVRELAWY